MILASDATIKPRQDSTPWRLGMLGAALEAVRKEWPQTAKWPVAFAGMSGGAKRSGVLGAMLARPLREIGGAARRRPLVSRTTIDSALQVGQATTTMQRRVVHST